MWTKLVFICIEDERGWCPCLPFSHKLLPQSSRVLPSAQICHRWWIIISCLLAFWSSLVGSRCLHSLQERHFCLRLLAQGSSNRLSPSNLFEKHPVEQYILISRKQWDKRTCSYDNRGNPWPKSYMGLKYQSALWDMSYIIAFYSCILLAKSVTEGWKLFG